MPAAPPECAYECAYECAEGAGSSCVPSVPLPYGHTAHPTVPTGTQGVCLPGQPAALGDPAGPAARSSAALLDRCPRCCSATAQRPITRRPDRNSIKAQYKCPTCGAAWSCWWAEESAA
jgi:hypothetical protein